MDDGLTFCIKEHSSGRFDIQNSLLIYGIIQSCQEVATLFQVDEEIIIPDRTMTGNLFKNIFKIKIPPDDDRAGSKTRSEFF